MKIHHARSPAQLEGLFWPEVVDNRKWINGKVLDKTFPRPLVSRLTHSKWPFHCDKRLCFAVPARRSSYFGTLFFSHCGVYLSLCTCLFLPLSPTVLSQGLWTEAHQCDGSAPQWQLPSAAGPWPVPRCLRRWCSPSAHCFSLFVRRLWLPFNEQTHTCLAEAQGLQGSLYAWQGPQLFRQIAPSF